MVTRTCQECTTAFAVGLLACPNCSSTDHEETGMAKISRLNGPSNKREVAGDGSGEALPPLPVEAYAPDAAPLEGGEEPSPGTSSSASTRKTAASSETSAAPRRGRARTTASRSKRVPEESTTALGATTSTSETDESSDDGLENRPVTGP